ncbi:MAG: glutamate racemase [Calditrichaceae bacterium]|nr:glutamate racemase [Calditrichia bacterium]NUQ41154.1 glutamate racemase [Calditrichaceae bacterium]
MSKTPPSAVPQSDPRPIGVFDSGIGGLTVVKQLMSLMPGESIVYFGDTARIPYGSKSVEVVKRFALEDSFFLLEKNVKMIVVACNTASAIAVGFLKEVLPAPITGVIQPGVRAAARRSRKGKIGVIGTTATVRSSAYYRELLGINPRFQVISRACPLLVPLVEEGWIEDEATYLIARRYLQPLIENHIDALILGCTHYPLLKNVIRRIVGEEVALIDSGVETAARVQEMLAENRLFAPPNTAVEHQFYLSDLPYKFQEIGERFLERSLPHVETVNFEEFIMDKGRKFWESFKEKLRRGNPARGNG